MGTLNLRRFTDPDFLKKIAPDLLCALLRPWRDHLRDQGFELPADTDHNIDCDALALILADPKAAPPKDMIDALYYVNETSTAEDMDALIDRAKAASMDLKRDLLTTPADIAIKVWLAGPEILRERHAETFAFKQKRFVYFSGADRPRELPPIDEALRRQLECSFDDWFETHRRGRGCRLFVFSGPGNTRMLVRHGLPTRREASHRDDGKPAVEVYRPQTHDVLIYDPAAGELGIHADTKGERDLYLYCVGKLVFGGENHFPTATKYSLSPLLEKGPASLLCEDVPGLEFGPPDGIPPVLGRPA